MKPCHRFLARMAWAMSFGAMACADPVEPRNESRSSSESTRPPNVSSSLGDAESEFSTEPRFEIVSSLTGDLRPGGNITVVAQIHARHQTKDAQIRLIVPEVELAKQGRFDPGSRFPLSPIQPIRIARQPMAAGSLVELQSTFSVPSSGYYRVAIQATAETEPIDPTQTTAIQNTIHADVWFTVAPNGGVVTNGYDEDVYPSWALHQPGPFRILGSVVPTANPQVATSITPRMSSAMVSQTDQIIYYNADTAAFVPLADARYQVTVVYTGGSQQYAGQTNANGELTFTCPGVPASATIKVFYEKAGMVEVWRNTTWKTEATTILYPQGFVCGPGGSHSVNPGANGPFAARVFSNARFSITASRGNFPTRAQIRYDIMTDGTTNYTPNDDRIRIDTTRVWGADGIFVADHEYGHAVHEKAVGGLRGATCPSPHLFTGYYTFSCAWKEGFANFHSAVGRGSSIGAAFTIIRDGLAHGGQNGATNEASVAAFLYDLTDAPDGETFDQTFYTFSYITAIYNTCDSYFPFFNSWSDANQSNGNVYCFEQIVDPTVKPYFYDDLVSNPNRIGNYSEGATEPGSWNRNSVRSVWKRNYFNQ